MKYGLTVDQKQYKSQVLVVGGGGAGLSAGLAAAETGADVILIEKRRYPGGNTALAGGMFAANSPYHKRNGIEVNEDELFLLAMDFAHWTINPRLMRAFISKSGDTLAWLESYGLTFTQVFEDVKTRRKFFNMYIPPVQHVPRGYGAGLIQSLYSFYTKQGGRTFCDVAAKELIIENGKLCGVIAEHEGKEIRFIAESVILATGDFGANKELLHKYCRYYHDNMFHKGVPNQGDGLQMGLRAGAGTANLGSLMVEPGWIMDEPNEMWYFTAIRNQPIWLNSLGERFVNEASYRTRGLGWLPVSWQPGCIHYSVFDEGILRDIIEGYDTAHFKAFGRHGNPPDPVSMEEAKQLLHAAASRGKVVITDNMDDIADFIGVTSEKLNHTIREYNDGCKSGHDIFAKDAKYLLPLREPPFYALRCVPRYLVTMGGLKINERMEVLDPDGKILSPGLYAVGDTAGGFECECYNANLYGAFVGFAVNSGRIAGEEAAKRASQQPAAG